MNESDDEFHALMARVDRDDNQALARLIALYEPTIRRSAHVLLGKASDRRSIRRTWCNRSTSSSSWA